MKNEKYIFSFVTVSFRRLLQIRLESVIKSIAAVGQSDYSKITVAVKVCNAQYGFDL